MNLQLFASGVKDYAVKYSPVVDEKFRGEAKSEGTINHNYDFVGAKTVKVYRIETAPMNDYKRSGQQRYGSAEELAADTDEMTMTQDRSFTFTIDKMNEDETAGALQAGAALARQLEEVVIPEIDKYRFTQMAINAGTKKSGEITKENVADEITTATEALDDARVPVTNRFLVVTPATYRHMKNSKEIVLDTEVGQEMKLRGVIAMYDGMEIIKSTSHDMPEGANFIAGHDSATVSPVKLAEYKIHTDPQGISGSLVEGRVYYDAFILKNKVDGLYYHGAEVTEGE